MTNWTQILDEADWVSEQLYRQGIDLAEAQKVGDYFVRQNYSDKAMAHYLELLANRPPPRSQRSQRYFKGLQKIWSNWRTTLSGADKARAWGWGVRGVRVLKK